MMVSELDSYDTFEGLIEGITNSIIDKSIFKWEIPADFDRLYELLVTLSCSASTLRVIATLGRVEAAVKKPVFDLGKAGKLITESPDLKLLQEGDDRYYVALFIARLCPEDIYTWALGNVWAEPASEKARIVFTSILLDYAESFEAVLGDISKTGLSYAKEMDLNESKVCVRFLRVIRSLRVNCQGRDLFFDIGVGKEIDTFVGSPFTHFTGAQKKINVRKNLVPEVAGLLLDLIGQRFSLAIESEHYLALKRVRQWCDSKVWSDLIKKNSVLGKLSRTISEALLILSRQNISDGDLLKRLQDSVVGEKQFKALCQGIADSGHLDRGISKWLLSGGQLQQPKKKITSEKDVSSRALLNDIGDLLLRMQEGSGAIQIAERALEDLELFDPSLTPVIRGLSNHWGIAQAITGKIADRNSVSLVGTLGEQVDADRSIFEFTGECDTNQRRGMVIRSAVVIVSEGKTVVIKKGIIKTLRGIENV